MAFRNTRERYSFIYGSSVRKLDEDYDDYIQVQTPARKVPKKKPVKKAGGRRVSQKRAVNRAQRERAVERNLKALKAFDWKYTSVIILSLMLVLFGALFYVQETAVINSKERTVYALKEEKVKLIGKQTAIQSEIDKSTDLTKIEQYAIKNLKMVYPNKKNTLYYTGGSEDYFRQYESVGSQ